MNTNITNTESVTSQDLQTSRTLQTLLKVICADNEFTLLRKTLELYCEEIEAVGQRGGGDPGGVGWF